MCTSYSAIHRMLLSERFQASLFDERDYKAETYQDYLAPIIRHDGNGKREAVLAGFSMIPKRHMPEGKRYTTMNARAETIGQKPTYARYWRAGQLALVPMHSFYEPCYETGNAIRWSIGMDDEQPFAVAGVWRTWREEDGGSSVVFTMITVNADAHPLMSRFHKPPPPGEPPDKRSLVIVPQDDYDAWLGCRDPEIARTFLRLYPAELMAAAAAPLPKRVNAAKA